MIVRSEGTLCKVHYVRAELGPGFRVKVKIVGRTTIMVRVRGRGRVSVRLRVRVITTFIPRSNVSVTLTKVRLYRLSP